MSANNHPQKVITSLINGLSPKQKDVLIKRFGLKDGKRRTLEAIGDEHGITRERVRQIEEDALNNLRKPQLIIQINEFLNALQSHIENHGGIKKEGHLFEEDANAIFTKHKFTNHPKPYIHLLLALGEPFERHNETKDWHSFWTTDKSVIANVKSAVFSLHEKLKNHNQPIDKTTLINFTRDFAKQRNISTTDQALASYISISKNINPNIFGQYGLSHWPEINPRGMKDKAYLILKRLNKPLHFMQVAKEIEKAGLAKKQAHPQTVHNELIKDNRFVLVGRGTYALTDWGYTPGTIKDVIAKSLSESQKPLSKEEIISAVLNQRQVKENTILLNLQNRKLFKKTDEGYILA